MPSLEVSRAARSGEQCNGVGPRRRFDGSKEGENPSPVSTHSLSWKVSFLRMLRLSELAGGLLIPPPRPRPILEGAVRKLHYSISGASVV